MERCKNEMSAMGPKRHLASVLRVVEPFSRGMFDVVDLSRPRLRGVR
jgi:hypothetical protein